MAARKFAERWRSLTPLTRRLVAFALVNTILANFALMVFFLTPWPLTTLGHLQLFLTGIQGEDSWGPMNRAYQYVVLDHQRPVYSEIFFDRQYKFQYPPSSLLVFQSLMPVSRLMRVPILVILNVISWVGVLLTCLYACMLFRLSMARYGPEPVSRSSSSRAERVTQAIVLGFLALTFYPVVKAYSLGQIQAWINALFTLAMWFWVSGKTRMSGVLLGVVCLIKPQYLLFALWGLLRRRWGFVVALALTVGAGVSFSVALFGLADHLDYLRVLSFISERGESYYPNQSVNGLVHRLLFNGYNLGWKGRHFPPFHPWVYGLTAASSIAFVLVALIWRASRREKGGIVDFCIIGLTCTMASPVAWEHHYGILLPMFAFMLPRLMADKVLGRRTLAYFCMSYVLCSNFFAVSTALAAIPIANIGQSYVLAGVLLLWVSMLILRRGGKRAV